MLNVYLIMHVFGLVLVSTALVALGTDSNLSKRTVSVSHGVGLLLMLVAGFGMLARLGIAFPWPGWLWLKLMIFALLGAMPVLIRKGSKPAGFWFAVLLCSVAVAIILAVTQPF